MVLNTSEPFKGLCWTPEPKGKHVNQCSPFFNNTNCFAPTVVRPVPIIDFFRWPPDKTNSPGNNANETAIPARQRHKAHKRVSCVIGGANTT